MAARRVLACACSVIAGAMGLIALPHPAGATVDDGGRRVAMEASPSGEGYWVGNRYGHVAAFGDAWDPSMTNAPTLHHPAVAVRATPSGRGLYVATSKGGVFTFGDAAFRGSAVDLALHAPVVDIEVTPDGGGYWLLSADGGVFTFGNAAFLGSAAHRAWDARFVAIAATAEGDGYWLRRDDGAVFPFGAADGTLGPASVMRGLRAPVVDMAASPAGGHWLAAADGGVFAFGAPFYGSAADLALNGPITDIVATPSGHGYWLLGEDGGVFSYGDAEYRGSATDPRSPGAVATAGGNEVRMESGSSCWSNARAGVCGDTLGPGAHTPRMTVRVGDEVAIRFLIDGRPSTVGASIAPWGSNQHRSLDVPASNPTRLRVAGPPGDYLLAVSSTWRIDHPYDSQGGDAAHYLRLRVVR